MRPPRLRCKFIDPHRVFGFLSSECSFQLYALIIDRCLSTIISHDVLVHHTMSLCCALMLVWINRLESRRYITS